MTLILYIKIIFFYIHFESNGSENDISIRSGFRGQCLCKNVFLEVSESENRDLLRVGKIKIHQTK